MNPQWTKDPLHLPNPRSTTENQQCPILITRVANPDFPLNHAITESLTRVPPLYESLRHGSNSGLLRFQDR